MSDISNKERASYGAVAVELYCQSIEGGHELYDSTEIVAVDLIGDVCHWLAANNVDPEKAVQKGLDYFKKDIAKEVESA